MPDPTPPDAILAMRRQIRRVRWRRNLYELQRGAYLLIATGTAATAVIVLLALRADTRAFALAAWALGLAAVVLAGASVAATRRRWLRASEAHLWIDRQAGLGGRLATLAELGTRSPPPVLLPLLVEENGHRLGAWAPDVILPDSFPSEALGAALAGTCALVVVALLGPRLEPSGRVAIVGAPVRVARRGDVAATPSGVTLESEEDGEASSLTRLPAALQERIRRRVWGAEWAAAREATARGAGGDARGASSPADGGELEQSWQIARPATLRPAARRPRGDPGDEGASQRGDARDARADAPATRRDGESAGPGEAAPGAGTGTDPNLLGAATDPGSSGGRFELPLAAHVRAVASGPRPPSGEAPPAATDGRPDLGARQRRDAPVLRMDVPPAYEAIVRRLFARAADGAP